MKRFIAYVALSAIAFVFWSGDACARGFGGFRAGGFSGFSGGLGGGLSGFRAGGVSDFSGLNRNVGYSSFRSGDAFSGLGGGFAASGSYDRNLTGSRGGDLSVSGDRAAVGGPLGGFAAGGTRNVSAVGPDGRTYSGSKQTGVAVGPYGRVIGGDSRSGIATGPGGAIAGRSQTAFAGTRFPTDLGLSHFSAFNTTAVGHSTAYWSNSYIAGRATGVRTNFGYYSCFRPDWYKAHPDAWYASGWAAGAAWAAATWSNIAAWCTIPAAPVYFDYGSTIVYQNNNVYVNGQDAGTAQDYAKQATAVADKGQQAAAPPKEEWKALGVFALVPGDEKTSNNLFQLAVNKDGILRGNYYDGVMDTTTPVYGSVDAKSQRAAWTIGKKNDRVFETGIYNLTKNDSPVLVHFGTDRTEQWLLVRVEQSQAAQGAGGR